MKRWLYLLPLVALIGFGGLGSGRRDWLGPWR